MSQTENSRYGRVGSNARNESNEVFQFGSNLAYPNGKRSLFLLLDQAIDGKLLLQTRSDFIILMSPRPRNSDSLRTGSAVKIATIFAG
jgi:hypothetical protein